MFNFSPFLCRDWPRILTHNVLYNTQCNPVFFNLTHTVSRSVSQHSHHSMSTQKPVHSRVVCVFVCVCVWTYESVCGEQTLWQVAASISFKFQNFDLKRRETASLWNCSHNDHKNKDLSWHSQRLHTLNTQYASFHKTNLSQDIDYYALLFKYSVLILLSKWWCTQ